MAVYLRRLPGPPAGTLLAALKGSSAYADCFEVALPLTSGLSSSLSPAPAVAAALGAVSLASHANDLQPMLFNQSLDTANDTNEQRLCDSNVRGLPDSYLHSESLVGRDALTAYLRSFYTSPAFAPERLAMPYVGLPPAPTVDDLLESEFDVGYRVGPFAVTHRGSIPHAGTDALPDDAWEDLVRRPYENSCRQPHKSRRSNNRALEQGSFLQGSEAALGWGPFSGAAGVSYHALAIRQRRQSKNFSANDDGDRYTSIGRSDLASRVAASNGKYDRSHASMRTNDMSASFTERAVDQPMSERDLFGEQLNPFSGSRHHHSNTDASHELVFLFGSLLWRAPPASTPDSDRPWSLTGTAAIAASLPFHNPLSSSSEPLDRPKECGLVGRVRTRPRLPVSWRLFSVPHRLYSRALLAAAVDRHLRTSHLV